MLIAEHVELTMRLILRISPAIKVARCDRSRLRTVCAFLSSACTPRSSALTTRHTPFEQRSSLGLPGPTLDDLIGAVLCVACGVACVRGAAMSVALPCPCRPLAAPTLSHHCDSESEPCIVPQARRASVSLSELIGSHVSIRSPTSPVMPDAPWLPLWAVSRPPN